jgi:hypothetical protein
MEEALRGNERRTAIALRGGPMPETMILLYGALVLAPLVLFGIALWSGVERWRREADIERRVRARWLRRPIHPVPRLSLVAEGPRGEAPFRRGRSAA